MTVQSRKARGMATQRIVCEALQDVFPGCYPPGAGESGEDVRNAPGWSIEIKARRAFNPLEWMRQVMKSGSANRHVVIMRPDGAGPATVDSWPAFMTVGQLKGIIDIVDTYDMIMSQRKMCDERTVQ